MRDALKTRIEGGGHYKVVDKPAADVVVARTALTNLYLKKKKRGLLAYTPVGAVAKVGVDALRETLDKVDIIEMAFEGELTDSKSGDVLVALVVERGARKADGQKEQRMDMMNSTRRSPPMARGFAAGSTTPGCRKRSGRTA